MELEFITSNDHKFEEINNKLSSINVTIKHRKMGYPEIQADRIIDIARYSLSLMATTRSSNFIIEDSGIVIQSLNGFPGPYSSFVFRTIGCQGILDVIEKYQDRSAKFVSVIGLHFNHEFYYFTGECEGIIANKIRGSQGFGFDPIFIPKGQTQTFAEMNIEVKNKISHRSKSVESLIEFLQE